MSLILDAAALDDLRRIGGDPLVRELIDLFLTEVPQQWTAAREAEVVNLETALRQAAHSIKTSAEVLGARRLLELCDAVEQGPANGTAGPENLLQQLEHALAEACAALQRLRDGLPS